MVGDGAICPIQSVILPADKWQWITPHLEVYVVAMSVSVRRLSRLRRRGIHSREETGKLAYFVYYTGMPYLHRLLGRLAGR